jgi:chromosome segregation ATPase
VGKVVDRLLAGRDARSAEATAALADAVSELARRLADLSDRVDRARDTLHQHEGRSDDLAAADGALRAEAEELGRRLGDVESGLATTRGDLDGALEQDRITAGILADAEERLADDLGDLRLRVAKLAVEVADETPDPPTETAPDTAGDPVPPTDPADTTTKGER